MVFSDNPLSQHEICGDLNAVMKILNVNECTAMRLWPNALAVSVEFALTLEVDKKSTRSKPQKSR